MARQRLGQHFLGDEGWREQIARAIRVSPHSMHAGAPANTEDFCWIEIGAGHGEMTQHLLKSGAPVTAVELDPPLIKRLESLAEFHRNLKVVHGDILTTDLAAIADGKRMRIYGNLPYYITSPILHHFFEYAALIEEIHVVIQLEVAQRLVAQAGSKSYGYLSVLTQYYARPDLALRIPRGAFRPPPEVDSALVSMRLPGESAKLKIEDEAGFLEFVKTCFAQKRKMLANNLRGIREPTQTREILKSLNLREDARAEQLSVEELAAVFRAAK
ncbi:MAG TPA: 16S rRNA (adenine(1518)-N(6)/adenine(1519)-N(6))-dimethyltransferase RsmA [Candidatus Acidoferrum sp.]|jgi:16S rRNA (adenine1518-N6/adenine1519-N6)-dimethyltransferase